MKMPKHSGRWLLALVSVLILHVFIAHPVEVVWTIAAGFFLITAWYLIFGSPRSPLRKVKDRTFRHPPWT
jgi:hypothetical protein